MSDELVINVSMIRGGLTGDKKHGFRCAELVYMGNKFIKLEEEEVYQIPSAEGLSRLFHLEQDFQVIVKRQMANNRFPEKPTLLNWHELAVRIDDAMFELGKYLLCIKVIQDDKINLRLRVKFFPHLWEDSEEDNDYKALQ